MPQKFSKNSQDFENNQFPTLHLEAENLFGLIFYETEFEVWSGYGTGSTDKISCTFYDYVE